MVFYRERIETKISHRKKLIGQSWGKAPNMELLVVLSPWSQVSNACQILMCDHMHRVLPTREAS